MRQLGPTNATPRCRTTIEQRKEQQQQNVEHDELVVVVRSFGVVKATEAVAAARSRGLRDEHIREIIEAFEARPEGERCAGMLKNWLAEHGSYERERVQANTPALRTCKGLSPADERRRGELIRHARKKGWSLERQQRAVSQFEAECLDAQGIG